MAATLRATVLGVLLASALAPVVVLAAWEWTRVQRASASGDPSVLPAFLAVLALAASGALLLSTVLTARVIAPIRRLERAAASAQDDAPMLPRDVDARAAREVQSLHASLTRMSDRLRALSESRARSLAETRADLDAVEFTIAHEIREPLRSLRTLAQAVGADGSPAEAREALALVGAKAARLERLVAELERYDAVARRQDVVAAPVDLRDLVDEAVALARPVAPLTTRIIGPLPDVRGDRDALATAIFEIVRNAAQHGARHLAVHAAREGPDALVIFDDDGPGIPAARREDALQLFQRLGAASDGTGVGLAIARRVATSHDGDVTIDASPAGGARVTLRVKAAGPASRAPAAAHASGRRF